MAKKYLSRFEFIILVLFVGSLMVWIISECRSTQLEYELEQLEQQIQESRQKVTQDEPPETPAIEAPVSKPVTLSEPAKTNVIASDLPGPPASATPATVTPPTQGPVMSKLYVTIDQLKLRTKPDLTSQVMRQLSLFDEVYFMNSVSENVDTINLGNGIAAEPWIFVQTKDGMKGWVYGAGINYYKKKNPKAL